MALALEKIVFMGDSITEFWQSKSNFFSKHSNFLNKGISGQTTSQMIVRLQRDVIDEHPNTMILLAGINDIAENSGPISLEDVFQNIVTMTERALTNKIKVILCSVLPATHFLWRPDIEIGNKITQLNLLIKTFADANNIIYVDYYTAMVDSTNGLDIKYGEDGVHPNSDGYLVMERLINEQLK